MIVAILSLQFLTNGVDEEKEFSVFAHDFEDNSIQCLWKLDGNIISSSSSTIINSTSLQTALPVGTYDLQVEVWSKDLYLPLKYSCQIKIKETIPNLELQDL